MHSKSDNEETMTGNDTDEIISEIFDSLLRRCQIYLEQQVKGRNFLFDYVYRQNI